LALGAIALAGCVWPQKAAPILAIEEIAVSDNPVATMAEDLLGRAALVARLRQFISNPKTHPPLVISMQGAWGSGKSSILRMLKSELEAKQAARAVWFNAWHYQEEDRLLVNLLDAVRAQAIPSLLTPGGWVFRVRLFLVRLTTRRRDLGGVVAGLAMLAAAAFWKDHPLAGLQVLAGAPDATPYLRPAVLVFGALLSLSPMKAFAASPEALARKGQDGLSGIIEQLRALPRITGRLDVRREFEENLQDVVGALAPQKRLVIFLDDLDRCPPDNIVRILEAVNFLSTAAECFIFLGADYAKVETLVSMHYEPIALAERQNADAAKGADAPAPDPPQVRLDYARAFMRKIINLRINLPPLEPERVKGILAAQPRPKPGSWLAWLGLALSVIAIVGGAYWLSTQPAPVPTAAPIAEAQNAPGATGLRPTPPAKPPGPNLDQKDAHKPTSTPDIENRDDIGLGWERWLGLGAFGIVMAVMGAYLALRRIDPPDERESRHFADALEAGAGRLVEALRTPREIRRFLNYLRLVTAPGDAATKARAQTVRQRLAQDNENAFDAQMVELAIGAATGDAEHAIDPDVRALFEEGCRLFGLNPTNFKTD
jgi:hypothetical protein